ncbi:conserved Plasmodium protein, unknown function [Plasmodium reichenowi]|uniref:Uncharacterized protein n=1 Tax=Plasmodium reichenowi TaxID=5854 RepID=A0A2P9DP32_PLARE|nr:conserved Plasmodium protein, unknown function [Plasmodium reichenowi]
MDENKYFKENFIYVDVEKEKEEKKKVYVEYIKRCFNYLLKQDDNFILFTLKKNVSLLSYFFSYLLKSDRNYDHPFELLDDDKKYNAELNLCILNFYLKLVDIYLNKNKCDVLFLKNVFIKIHIMMDIIMMCYTVDKKNKRIKTYIYNIYNKTQFNCFYIFKYIKHLYEELKNMKKKLEHYITYKNKITHYIVQLNELLFTIYCFCKFFKKYHYFDIKENKLSNELIIVKLMIYTDDKNNIDDYRNNNTSQDMLLKGDTSFLYIFIQTYVEMINHVYDSQLNDGHMKDILFLRYRYMCILNMLIKYNLKYGDSKNSVFYFSIIIDMLKEKSNKTNIQFIKNDIQLCNWFFLDKYILEGNVIDLYFFSYINNFMNLKNKKQVEQIIHKKYKNEIDQIKEITNVNNNNFILKILKKYNFNISQSIEYIFTNQLNQDNNQNYEKSDGDDDEDNKDEDNNDDDDNDEDNNDDDDNDNYNNNNYYNNNYYNNNAQNIQPSDNMFYKKKMNKILPGNEKYNNIDKDINEDILDMKNKKLNNVLELLKKRNIIKSTQKKKTHKYKYINNTLDEENKNKILNISESSSNDEESSDMSLDNFRNELINSNKYRKNKVQQEQDQENEQPTNINKVENTQLYEKHPLSFKSSTNNLNTIKNIKDEHNIQSDNKKRYYYKKTVHKGRSHRNNFDRKMSKGMF